MRGGGYKFIVVQLTDGGGEKKLIVRANENCEFHADIFDELLRHEDLDTLSPKCVGGGNIEVDPEEKRIRIRSSSSRYGREPDRQLTVRMLQVAFPDYQVKSDDW